MSLRFGRALIAKKASASCWSAVEAAAKQKPVMTPVGSTAVSKLKPSYHPRLLDHPMSARPASHPCPRRLQSRTGIARRAIQSFVRSPLSVQHSDHQMHHEGFDELRVVAHEA